MKPQGGWRGVLFPAVLTVCLLLSLAAGGIYFAGYLQAQIFAERSTQLNEITSQVRANLDNALDSHWNYLSAAVNTLGHQDFDTEEEVAGYIGGLEELLEMHSYSSMLMLLDSKGNCYDASGRHGVWPDIDRISDGETRYTFLSDSLVHEGSYWAFVQKLDAPLETREASFTHAVLLKDVYALSAYYDSSAYGSQNETYILKSNGTRMHDNVSGDSIIQAYNVLKALEEMEEQTIPDLRAALDELGVPLPAAARFYDEGKGRYTFRAANLEQDGLFYDGSIECRVSKSGRLYEVDSAMAAVTLHGDAPVISQQEAYRRLCAGRFDHTNAFAFGFVDTTQGEVHVTACDLEYLTDSKGFRQPVYYFSLSDSNDETLRDGCSWRVFVPALA